MAEIEKTVEEKIAEAVAAKDKEWQEKFQKQVNEASKAERIKAEKELEKAKLTETERIAAEQKEKWDALVAENEAFKTEKSINSKKAALSEAKLPSFYANDVRLLNAKDDEVKEVIKTLAKEHNDWLISNKLPTQSTTPNLGSNKNETMPTAEEFAKMTDAQYFEWRKTHNLQK